MMHLSRPYTFIHAIPSQDGFSPPGLLKDMGELRSMAAASLHDTASLMELVAAYQQSPSGAVREYLRSSLANNANFRALVTSQDFDFHITSFIHSAQSPDLGSTICHAADCFEPWMGTRTQLAFWTNLVFWRRSWVESAMIKEVATALRSQDKLDALSRLINVEAKDLAPHLPTDASLMESATKGLRLFGMGKTHSALSYMLSHLPPKNVSACLHSYVTRSYLLFCHGEGFYTSSPKFMTYKPSLTMAGNERQLALDMENLKILENE